MNIYTLDIISLSSAIVAAFVAVQLSYFRLLAFSKKKKLYDRFDMVRPGNQPTPILGGVVVFFGSVMGLFAGCVVSSVTGLFPIFHLLPVLTAMVVMLYIGVMDDMEGLSPSFRLFVEIITLLGLIYASGSCIDTFQGLWGVESFSWWLAVPLTVFAGVGIINGVNMIDGINGLSSTLCLLCSLFFGFIFVRGGDIANAILAFTVAAALLPFMFHNIFGFRSRMFIGDAGTMVMGITLTWYVISLLRSNTPYIYFGSANGVNMIAFALAVLCLPVFDTLRVMAMRIFRGVSPFQRDSNHLHHTFVKVGFSHFVTTLCEVCLMIFVVITWVVAVLLFDAGKDSQLYVVILASAFFVWGSYALLRYHSKHHTELLHRLTEVSIQSHLGRKKWWKRLEAFLDAPVDKYIAKYEEKELVVQQDIASASTPVDPDNTKEIDRQKVLNFMRGRAEVMVHDIMKNSGANSLHVYPILFEEVQKGRIRIVRNGYLGAPEIVTTMNEYFPKNTES